MSAYMRRDIWQLHPVDVIVSADHMIEAVLPMHCKAVKDSLSSGAKESSKVDEKPVAEVPAPKTEETPAKEEKTYSKEEVRALLSQKAKADSAKYKVEVKALVAKYSSDGTLTNVPVESYADLMAELEVVGNG